jgi:hypothetical protein
MVFDDLYLHARHFVEMRQERESQICRQGLEKFLRGLHDLLGHGEDLAVIDRLVDSIVHGRCSQPESYVDLILSTQSVLFGENAVLGMKHHAVDTYFYGRHGVLGLCGGCCLVLFEAEKQHKVTNRADDNIVQVPWGVRYYGINDTDIST